jgi:DNA invertase Pin-like site-specific DNA recombinase
MTSAYSYVRFSTPEQIKGDSLRRQLAASEAYAEAHGLELDSSLSMRDLGVSAYRGANRTKGALGAFLKQVEMGAIPAGSVLLVESLDRLTREQAVDAHRLFLSIIGGTGAVMYPASHEGGSVNSRYFL